MNLDKKEILAKHMANWMVQGKTPGSKHHLEAMQEYAEEYAKAFMTWFHTTQRNHDPGYAHRNAIYYMNQFKESLKK